jgi:uncharacterized protein (DUF1697 family)
MHVALLRGVNVGGNRKLPMKDLATLFEQAGCTSVRTFIQSGNVVFAARAALAKKVPALLADAIEARFGFRVPIALRTGEELASLIQANPFLPAADPKTLHVGFLVDTPARALVDKLDPRYAPPDEFRVIGRDIYLCYPQGLGKSKLTNAYFDSRLGIISTVRNWNTVNELARLAA